MNAKPQAVQPAAGAPPSPCTSVCRMDPHSGLCQGCWRTLDEIAQWSTASDADKRAVLEAVQRRRAAATQGHGSAALPEH